MSVSWLALLWTGQSSPDNATRKYPTSAVSVSPKYLRHTKPGSWVEFKDWDLHITSPDNSLPKDSYLYQYHKLIEDAIAKMHREYSPGPNLKKWAEEAGYVNVTERIIPLPIGVWPKDKDLVRRFVFPFHILLGIL